MTEHDIITLAAAVLYAGDLFADIKKATKAAIEIRAESARQLQAQHKSDSAREQQQTNDRRRADRGHEARRDEPRGFPRRLGD